MRATTLLVPYYIAETPRIRCESSPRIRCEFTQVSAEYGTARKNVYVHSTTTNSHPRRRGGARYDPSSRASASVSRPLLSCRHAADERGRAMVFFARRARAPGSACGAPAASRGRCVHQRCVSRRERVGGGEAARADPSSAGRRGNCSTLPSRLSPPMRAPARGRHAEEGVCARERRPTAALSLPRVRDNPTTRPSRGDCPPPPLALPAQDSVPR